MGITKDPRSQAGRWVKTLMQNLAHEEESKLDSLVRTYKSRGRDNLSREDRVKTYKYLSRFYPLSFTEKLSLNARRERNELFGLAFEKIRKINILRQMTKPHKHMKLFDEHAAMEYIRQVIPDCDTRILDIDHMALPWKWEGRVIDIMRLMPEETNVETIYLLVLLDLSIEELKETKDIPKPYLYGLVKRSYSYIPVKK